MAGSKHPTMDTDRNSFEKDSVFLLFRQGQKALERASKAT